MTPHEAQAALDATRTFFDRTTRCLDEGDSGFQVTPDTMTVAATVAHVAQTVDWFHDALVDGRWNMDFEAMAAETSRVRSLAEARGWLAEAWERMHAAVGAMDEAALGASLGDNPILPAQPRHHIIGSVMDHTAHHRGALSVMARLRGKIPAMPYMET